MRPELREQWLLTVALSQLGHGSRLKIHAPTVADALRPPATLEQIFSVERTIGVPLPAEIRAAYLRHDGSRQGPSLFPGGSWWCCLEEMLRKWQLNVLLSTDAKIRGEYNIVLESEHPWDELEIRPEWWCGRWIPIGVTDTADSVYIDLLPGPKGQVGQLIFDGGMNDAIVLAPSLTSYLSTMADRYEQGHIVYDEGMKTASGALITYWDDLDRNG